MSNRNPSPTNRQLLIILGIWTGIIVIMISLMISFVSLLADWAITHIPISWEQKLGELIVPVYEQKAKDSPQQENQGRGEATLHSRTGFSVRT